jgi:hypothetical protein
MAQAITKSQKRLFVILGLVVAYAIYDLTTSKKKEATDQPPADVRPSAVAEAAVVAVESPVQPRRLATTYVAWKRDPFRGQISTGSRVNLEKVVESLLIPKMANFNLTAISKKGDASFALINDQVVGVGDQINGFRVIEIRHDKVILQKNNFTFNVSLPDDETLF